LWYGYNKSWGAGTISFKRVCAWEGCEKTFTVQSLFSRQKYCEQHKGEAQKSNALKRRTEYYQRNKRRINIEELGTISLGKRVRFALPLFYLGVKIPFSEFREEQKVIKNNSVNNNSVTGIYKGRKTNNNIWIDNCKTMEYGESQPIGIQNTHKYATFDDYYANAKHYLLKERGECPHCGCKDHYKSKIDVSCAMCGLVLEVNTKLMAWTNVDVRESEISKRTREPLSVQDVAWSKYWNENRIGVEGDESGM
jgi:hypothetical protein